MNQKAIMPPLLFDRQVQHRKQLYKERYKKEEEKKKHIAETPAKEKRENLKILQSILDKNPNLSLDNTELVILPKGLSNLVPLTKERKNKYTEHLTGIISEAFKHRHSSEVDLDEHLNVLEKLKTIEQRHIDSPSLRDMSDKLCSICKGGCCTSGSEHAYLSAITIKRYIEINTGLLEEEVLDLYLSHISAESMAGACINQTNKGCALPKELRSDTCNNFYCESLKDYQSKLEGEINPRTTLVIQRSGTCWNKQGSGGHNNVASVSLIKRLESESCIATLPISHNKITGNG